MTSYLKITLRNLRREKLYALINVLGLAIAITCTLLIGLYVYKELTYDQHLNNHEKIYRASENLINSDGSTAFSMMSEFMAPAMAREHPAIEGYVRFMTQASPSLLHINGQASYIENIYKTDDNVFETFGHQALYGDPKTALVDPSAVAVSNKFNQIHFNGADSIGQTIAINGEDYLVTLVYQDLPDNSHLKYDLLMSINDYQLPASERLTEALLTVNSYTYLIMQEDYDVSRFPDFFQEFWEFHTGEFLRGSDTGNEMTLTPVADVHFGPVLEYDQPVGNKFVVYAFAVVGFLILLIASVNYVNLATARSVRRAKEIGVRKILGVERRNLLLQFLFESIFFSLLAVMLAIAAVELILQLGIGGIFEAGLSSSMANNPFLLLSLLFGGVLLGLLSGAYPAVYLSSLLPLNLAGREARNKPDAWLRQAMVVVQFAITISVIASSLLMFAQMRFMQNSPLGFIAENRLTLHLKGSNSIDRVPALINRLNTSPLFEGATFTAAAPATEAFSGNWLVEDNNGEMSSRFLSFQNVDSNYLDVMGMELVEGRYFRPGDGRTSVVVNQALIQQMGWGNPIGMRTGGPGDSEGSEVVIGVVRDFHFNGLQSEISPLILRPSMPANFGGRTPELAFFQNAKLTVALNETNTAEAITSLQNIWQELMPELPFEYQFLDTVVEEQYAGETAIMTVIGYFAGICIFISCLGLLGLSAYSTEQRTKEIGIRKVLGASMAQIMGSLFKNIFFLVCIGSVIASFISYFTINSWLQNFAYRDEINLMVFPVSAGIAILLAFFTMALQSYKTISANPIEALRYE